MIAGVGTSATTVALPPGTPEMVVVVVSDPVHVDVIVLVGIGTSTITVSDCPSCPLLW